MTMRLTLFLLSSALLVWADDGTVDHHWQAFQLKYGRRVSNLHARKERFLAAKAAVDQHNLEAEQGLHSYTKTVNIFSVLTDEEKQQRFGLIPREMNSSRASKRHVMNRLPLPASLDLTACRCMPPVKDQGNCGAWAFSAVCAIEYQFCCLNSTPKPVLFSEQQLVDCSSAQGNGGCGGGWMDYAWNYLTSNDLGLMKLDDYPFTGQDGTCSADPAKGLASLSSFAVIPAGSSAVTDIKQALVTYGPVSVVIGVGDAFQTYSAGVFNGPCAANLNHAVTIVGYGARGNLPPINYWIVRNQWGSSWGQIGYIWMRAGVNLCSIESWAMYPVVKAL